MNKPQYLAELRRLLVFMTRADREQTISRCGELFDLAGPEGADRLVASIGSPTRVSIRLSRGYEPGRIDFSFLEEQAALAPPPNPAPEPEPEPEPGPAEPDMVAGMPDLDIPPMVMDDLSGFEMIPQPEPEPEPVPEPEPAGDAPPEGAEGGSAAEGDGPPADAPDTDSPATPVPAAEPASDRPSDAHAPEPPSPAPGPRFVSLPLDGEDAGQTEEEATDVIIERTVPLWLGIPLFIVSLVVLALPVGAICLLLLPVLIAPGLALLLCTWLAAVGGLWCISYIADALMLFGLAFIILGFALIVLWCGLRLDTAIVTGFVRACRGVTHLTLGRKVILDA